eukprot:1013232-Rhodomonas_salina.1
MADQAEHVEEKQAISPIVKLQRHWAVQAGTGKTVLIREVTSTDIGQPSLVMCGADQSTSPVLETCTLVVEITSLIFSNKITSGLQTSVCFKTI